MIDVHVSEESLTVVGHADDRRVCNAVSALLATLYYHWGAPKPTSGRFSWNGPRCRVTLEFCQSFFATLGLQYADQIRVTYDRPAADPPDPDRLPA